VLKTHPTLQANHQERRRTIVRAKKKKADQLKPLNREEVVEKIRSERLSGNLTESIHLCSRAKETWPRDFFFAKILADLHFQNEDHKSAFLALADYVALIPANRRFISDFAQRYYRFRRVLSTEEMARFAQLLRDAIDESQIDKVVSQQVKEIIGYDIKPVFDKALDKRSSDFIESLGDDSKFNSFVKAEKQIESEDGNQRLVEILNANILNRTRSSKTYRIDLYCVSIYEKIGLRENALKIVVELISLRQDTAAVRLLFRICRMGKDYSPADALLEKYPSLLREREFNVQYELVYYFEAKNDFHTVQGILRAIDKSFAQNYPVLRTVRNFYIRFGMLEEAKRLEQTIFKKSENNSGGKYSAQVVESGIELASKVQDLYSQLEHQKQLAAISDLTTGISHELGQPITNIRYTIQYHRKLLAKNPAIDQVSKVFDSILEETERMGGLIRRLAPLTSSRGLVEKFDVMERITRRVEGEEPRLQEGKISVSISPKKPIWITGDPVKFDQLISNLILNAIDAIDEKKEVGNNSIDITVASNTKDTKISFADTGIGIPIGNRNKIFDPFFSTKPPGKGEGLGLFIVWNLLKMLGAKIHVDDKYKTGAKFLITIPK
jgi:signal transduction histidine kinase